MVKVFSWFKIPHIDTVAAFVSGLLTLVAWNLEGINYLAAIFTYMISYIIGSYFKTKEGILNLIKNKELDVNLLMFIAAAGAAAIGFWLEGGILIFIFSLSGALESYALARSEKDISSLMKMNPDKARLYLEDGSEKSVPVQDIALGDLVLIKPGEVIPVDAVVHKGESDVNQATITGESVPVDVQDGDEVFAGTLNGSGSLIVRVIRTDEETVFTKIIKLLETSKEQLPKSQQGIERIEQTYVKLVLLMTGALIAGAYFILGWSFSEAFYKAMVFLVVSSPCALVASIMPPILAGLSNAAKNGILFKAGEHLELLSKSSIIAFDKTGTLTKGDPRVKDIVLMGKYTEDEVLHIAASIEAMSTHPLAKAIVNRAKENNITISSSVKVSEIFGYGVEAEYDKKNWKIGKPLLFDEEILTSSIKENISKLQSEGKTLVLLGNTKEIVAILTLQDTVRDEAKEVIKNIKKHGIKIAMLTGDQPATADAIGRSLDIDNIHSALLPEDKVNIVIKMREESNRVTMVGDGINDAPALANANTGIALGKAGNNIAIENADVILMNNDLNKISTALNISKKTSRIIKQNIIFSLSVITLLVITNFWQGISLPFGVIYHEGSTLLVILNGLRLLTYKG